MIVRQNDRPRIVTDKGKVIAEFDESGIVKVDDKIAAKLVKLGYAADTTASDKTDDLLLLLFDTNGGAANDTNGETEVKASRGK